MEDKLYPLPITLNCLSSLLLFCVAWICSLEGVILFACLTLNLSSESWKEKKLFYIVCHFCILNSCQLLNICVSAPCVWGPYATSDVRTSAFPCSCAWTVFYLQHWTHACLYCLHVHALLFITLEAYTYFFFQLCLQIDRSGKIPMLRFRDRESYAGNKTKEYDDLAMKYLSYVLFFLVACSSVYSLMYERHRSWYSWILSSLTSCVYMFGKPSVPSDLSSCWICFAHRN